MITKNTNVIGVESNIVSTPDNSRAMGISVNSMASIMNSMTNLYTRRAEASLREYSTNALDANVMAANPAPVRITLPSVFDSTLIVADDGIGMSKEAVLDHYAQYGASSKRESNNQIGAFGFGCKAAFAIADQFTVVSVKDGIRVVVLFSRTSTGGGSATVLSEQVTTEANGVQVRIPIADTVTDVEASARRFFAAWPKGTVLVDGADPARLDGNGYNNGPVTLLDPAETESVFGDSFTGGQYVLMGNVMYAADLLPDNRSLPYNQTLIYRAGIGEVDIVPSREGVQDSDHTKGFITRTFDAWREQVRAEVADRIATAPNAFALHAIRDEATRILAIVDPKNTTIRFDYNGVVVPSSVALDADHTVLLDYNDDNDRVVQFKGYRHSRVREYSPSHKKVLIISDVNWDDWNIVRRGVISLARQEDRGYATIIMVPETTNLAERFAWMIDGDPNVDLITAKDAIALAESLRKAQRASRPAKARKTKALMTYSYFQDGYSLTTTHDLLGADGAVVTYAEKGYAARITGLAKQVGLNVQVVVLYGGQTVEALTRRVQITPCNVVLGEIADAALAMLGDAQTLGDAVATTRVSASLWGRLNPDTQLILSQLEARFADRTLASTLTVPVQDKAKVDLIQRISNFGHVSAFGADWANWVETYTSACESKLAEKLLKRYPLLTMRHEHNSTASTSKIARHLVAYVNAVHVAQ